MEDDDSNTPRDDKTEFYKYLLGIPIIILIIFNAIGQSEYLQIVSKDISFNSNFFLCWFTQAWLIISFPLGIFFDIIRFFIQSLMYKEKKFSISLYITHIKGRIYQNPNFTWKRYILSAIPLTLLNFVSSWMWYISLDLIPVSINIALYRSSVIWLFILSVIFLKEQVKIYKIISVLVCVAGIVLVAVGNIKSSPIVGQKNEITGYILVLVSAFLFAVYEALYRKIIGRGNSWGVLLNQSLLGVFVILLVAPFIPLNFYVYHLEPVVIFNSKTVSFLAVNTVFAVSYYLLYAFGMAFTTPLFIAIGGLLKIPAGGIADYILHHLHYNYITILGFVITFIGVMIMNGYTFGAIFKKFKVNNESEDTKSLVINNE